MGIAVSLVVLGYLNVADWHAQYVAEAHISQMEQRVAEQDHSERMECLAQAQKFNERLAGRVVEGPVLDYRDQLFYREEPMMASIEIPKIGVKLPIYHGVEDNVLMAGVGHWESSSLPVGGESTHCVLMAHTGMRNTRMFDDLHLLEPGDQFVVRALGEPHAYEVRSAEVVEPSQVLERFGIREGEDLVTLVTCTPHGVNTHRLLVRAQRCDYVPDQMGEVGLDAYVNHRNRPLLIAAFLAAALSVAVAAGKLRGKRKKSFPATTAGCNEQKE